MAQRLQKSRHGRLGFPPSRAVGALEGAKSVDAVGIQLLGGQVLGNPQHVKLRFNTEFMKMAANHNL